jgi:hypothetical protein
MSTNYTSDGIKKKKTGVRVGEMAVIRSGDNADK